MEPGYDTYFGAIGLGAKQNSDIMRVLYTGSKASQSQASIVLFLNLCYRRPCYEEVAV